MAEKLVVHQRNNFETDFRAVDPETPESGELYPVKHIQNLTPYGMLLAGLGSCTAVVVNTYAQYHGIELEEVELTVEYERVFKDDCEHCEDISRYKESINIGISFRGKLTPQQQEKLFKISLQCPIHKMLKSGIEVRFQPAKTRGE
jgi:putative redox protein